MQRTQFVFVSLVVTDDQDVIVLGVSSDWETGKSVCLEEHHIMEDDETLELEWAADDVTDGVYCTFVDGPTYYVQRTRQVTA